MEEYVYFIEAAAGPIKIGFARNPKIRFFNIQTAHWDKLKLLGCVEGSMKNEKEWHDKYFEHNIRGEWFLPVKELKAEIKRELKARGVPELRMYEIFYHSRTKALRKVTQDDMRRALEVLGRRVSKLNGANRSQ